MAAERDTMVELDGVRKEFGDVTAVAGLDFEVRRGEFFTLVGPSGCGKTTTLRMISGFEQPTDGELRINDRPMAAVPPEARDTNLVFQHLSLFPHMTVGENVGYGLKKAGVDADARETAIEEYLDLVDLDGFADRNPGDLSGGQQQRVALARALVNEPSVLLLDEPLSSLDRKLRKRMQVELRKIHEKTQGSFFYVTHDQEVAMSMSDRIAVMNDGLIEQIGPPEEIYREPASEFVAEFIGDTNLFEGDVVERDGTAVVELGGDAGFTVPADGKHGRVTVSIRPEDFTIHPEGADGDFAGQVVERYFQGDKTNYVVQPDADLEPVQVVVQGRESTVDTGERAVLRVVEDAPVVFPPYRGFDGWLRGVNNYDGTVDRRGEDEVTVEVGAGQDGSAFGSPAMVVDPGTTITFEWTGNGGPHNVVFEQGPDWTSPLTDQAGHTESLEAAPSDPPTVWYYLCEPHRANGMKGAIVVGDPDSVAAIDPDIVDPN